jgi:hypothetical protein
VRDTGNRKKGTSKMGLDIEAIKRKLNQLQTGKSNSSVQLWKVKNPGDFRVRGLPWKDAPDGQPFLERWFYYIGNNRGILAPYQFGLPDPINDFIRELYNKGTPEDRELAKKLKPKMRAYMPLVVRGEEDKGVLVWSFGKFVYQRLLGFFLDGETGNILDPYDGWDLKVQFTQQAGKQFLDSTIDTAKRQSRLADDDETIKKLLDSVPNIDDMYKQTSPQEIESILKRWLDDGAQAQKFDDDVSTRGADAPPDALAQLATEVKGIAASSTGDSSVVPPVKSTKKAAKESAKTSDLDSAFNALMDDE